MVAARGHCRSLCVVAASSHNSNHNSNKWEGYAVKQICFGMSLTAKTPNPCTGDEQTCTRSPASCKFMLIPRTKKCLWTELPVKKPSDDFSFASRGCFAAAAKIRGPYCSTASLTASQVSRKLCVVILSGNLGARHSVSQDAMVQSATSLGGGLGSASLETNTATRPA